MNSANRVCRAVVEGLVFGFTFAIGWFAAVLLLGVAGAVAA